MTAVEALLQTELAPVTTTLFVLEVAKVARKPPRGSLNTPPGKEIAMMGLIELESDAPEARIEHLIGAKRCG